MEIAASVARERHDMVVKSTAWSSSVGPVIKQTRELIKGNAAEIEIEAGLTKGRLAKLESGNTAIGLDEFCRIAEVLGYTPGGLLNRVFKKP